MNERMTSVSARCSACNHKWQIETWEEIDGRKDSDAIQLIEDGIYFRHCCPNCGKPYDLSIPTVYCDESSLIIFIEGILNISEVNKFVQEMIEEHHVDTNMVQIRIASTCNEFMEKVILHRRNLDDRVVELIKLHALDVVRQEGYGQTFSETRCAVDDHTHELMFDFVGKEPRCLSLGLDRYDWFAQKALPILNQYKVPLEVNADWAIAFSVNHKI